MISHLLPCPFCGTEAFVEVFQPLLPNGMKDTLYVVRCALRECGTMTKAWYPREVAMMVWNRRTNKEGTRP